MPKSEAEVARAQEGVEAVFAALAHKTRRRILLVLQMRGGQLTAGQIAERFACAWPTTTRHLKLLVAAGLIDVTKQGRGRLYTLNRQRLLAVTREWLVWFDPD